MRNKLITFLKTHPSILHSIWGVARGILGLFVNITKQNKTILFCSFGGRSFNDSPKAIYDEICRRREFGDWNIIWAFVDPDRFNISRGEKVKVDTFNFFKALIMSKIWVSNSGMDRGIDLITDKIIRVETWHGAPLKKIGGEEHENSFGTSPDSYHGKVDSYTIRCAQSEFDREIFARVNHAAKDAILLCDLPRNDELANIKSERVVEIKNKLGLPKYKKVILYAPTYREYLVNENRDTYIAPPVDLKKWEQKLGNDYVLLIRAHYAVSAALNIKESDFIKDVSKYPFINDLYVISDILISDYSSVFLDYSILDRPMLCFAYDREEYERKRGLYLNLDEALPCEIDYDEDTLIENILKMNYKKASEKTREFHRKFTPHAGNASKAVVDEILKRLVKR